VGQEISNQNWYHYNDYQNHGFQNNRCRDTQQQATPKDKHATIEGKMGYGLARIENETAAQAGQKALEKDAR